MFALASVLLVPAFVMLATRAAAGSPLLATIGGTLVASSLLARLYFSGVDLTAFELVDSLGREAATEFVLGSYADLSYGLWYVPASSIVLA